MGKISKTLGEEKIPIFVTPYQIFHMIRFIRVTGTLHSPSPLAGEMAHQIGELWREAQLCGSSSSSSF